MPSYLHGCYECEHKWEDFYSINAEPPTICPECGGKARRLISGAPSFKVKLEGNELKQHIKDERKKIRNQVKSDEKLRANLMGEEKYNNTQNNVQKIGETLKQMI